MTLTSAHFSGGLLDGLRVPASGPVGDPPPGKEPHPFKADAVALGVLYTCKGMGTYRAQAVDGGVVAMVHET